MQINGRKSLAQDKWAFFFSFFVCSALIESHNMHAIEIIFFFFLAFVFFASVWFGFFFGFGEKKSENKKKNLK